MKEFGLLECNGEIRDQLIVRNLVDAHIAYVKRTAFNVVQPKQELDQRRFSRAGVTGKSDDFTTFYLECYRPDCRHAVIPENSVANADALPAAWKFPVPGRQPIVGPEQRHHSAEVRLA